MTAIEQMGN